MKTAERETFAKCAWSMWAFGVAPLWGWHARPGVGVFEATGLADGGVMAERQVLLLPSHLSALRGAPYGSSGNTLPKYPNPLLIITRSRTQ